MALGDPFGPVNRMPTDIDALQDRALVTTTPPAALLNRTPQPVVDGQGFSVTPGGGMHLVGQAILNQLQNPVTTPVNPVTGLPHIMPPDRFPGFGPNPWGIPPLHVPALVNYLRGLPLNAY